MSLHTRGSHLVSFRVTFSQFFFYLYTIISIILAHNLNIFNQDLQDLDREAPEYSVLQ